MLLVLVRYASDLSERFACPVALAIKEGRFIASSPSSVILYNNIDSLLSNIMPPPKYRIASASRIFRQINKTPVSMLNKSVCQRVNFKLNLAIPIMAGKLKSP